MPRPQCVVSLECSGSSNGGVKLELAATDSAIHIAVTAIAAYCNANVTDETPHRFAPVYAGADESLRHEHGTGSGFMAKHKLATPYTKMGTCNRLPKTETATRKRRADNRAMNREAKRRKDERVAAEAAAAVEEGGGEGGVAAALVAA